MAPVCLRLLCLRAGSSVNAVGLLGARSPAILWVGGTGDWAANGFDHFAQAHLFMGVFPMAPFKDADHSLPDSNATDALCVRACVRACGGCVALRCVALRCVALRALRAFRALCGWQSYEVEAVEVVGEGGGGGGDAGY